MNNFCIYMHTNPYTLKRYIGQTNRKPEYRWNNGFGYSENDIFFKDIVKYGWMNFTHEILESGLSQEEANIKEMFYIDKFQTADVRYGYNLKSNNGLSNISKQQIGKKNSKAILCTTTGQVFTSQIEAAKWCGLTSGSSISKVCHGVKTHAGRHPETNELLQWEFI